MRAKLLLVGCSPQDQVVLGGLLHDEYDTRTAEAGADVALDAAQFQPDLILLDFGAPEAMGAYAQLRAAAGAAELPVIAVIDDGDPEHAAYAIACGAADYLLKPYHPALVKARIGHHIELAQAHAAVKASVTAARDEDLFQKTLEAEWRRCGRASTYVSLLMIEVDGFDLYQARNGQAAADLFLEKMSTQIAGCMHRQPDLFTRYDERRFACLLPETSPAGAISVAERLRETAINLPPVLTISQGIATLMPSPDSSPAELLLQAEELLELAKFRGGHRICDGLLLL